MGIISATPGQSLNFRAEFRKQNGGTLAAASAATWVIKDHNGVTVVSGTGTQDLTNAALWTATTTIPSAAPIPPDGSKWAVTWRLPLANGSDAYQMETFDLVASGDESAEPRVTDVLVLLGTALRDSIALPSAVTTPSFKITDENGRTIATLVPTSAVSGQNKIWTVSGAADALKVPLGNAGYFLGAWTWTGLTGYPETEIHPIYVLNSAAMTLINNIRRFVDKARLQDIHPHLSYTDVDLLHYALRGIAYCNGIGPSLTYWSLGGLPASLTHFIEMAGALNAVQSQYLAEGSSTFDFQGLGVQLNVDRTQFLDNIAGQLNAFLDKLPDAKKAWVAAGSPIISNSGISTSRVIGAGASSYFAYNLPINMPVPPANPNGYIIGTLPPGFWGDNLNMNFAYWGR